MNQIFASELNSTKQDSAEARVSSSLPATHAAAEELMLRAWAAGLRGRRPDRHTQYWKLGINVNRSLDIIRELWTTAGIDLPANIFVEAPTISLMAARLHDGTAFAPRSIVKLRDGDEREPLFVQCGGTGLMIELAQLVHAIDYPGAIYGVALCGMDGNSPYSATIEEEAERVVKLISCMQPRGPYRLLGYSSGGCITLEIARTLRRAAERVSFVGLIDTGLTEHHWPLHAWLRYMVPEALKAMRKRLQATGRGGPTASGPPRPNFVPIRRGTRYEFRFRDPESPEYPYFSPYWRGDVTPREGAKRAHSVRMWGRYCPQPYREPVVFFVARGENPMACPPTWYWPRYLPRANWIEVPGNHITMMVGRNAARLGAQVSACLLDRPTRDTSAARAAASHDPLSSDIK